MNDPALLPIQFQVSSIQYRGAGGSASMNIIVMVTALFVGIIAENVIPACVFLGQAKVPVLMSIVIYYALGRSTGLMLISAIAGGVLYDSLSALPFGYSSLCFCVLGAVIRRYRKVVFSGKWVTHMFFGAISGMGWSVALYGLLVLTEPCIREVSSYWVIMKAVGVGAFGMVLTPVVFVIMEQINRLVGNITVKDSE